MWCLLHIKVDTYENSWIWFKKVVDPSFVFFLNVLSCGVNPKPFNRVASSLDTLTRSVFLALPPVCRFFSPGHTHTISGATQCSLSFFWPDCSWIMHVLLTRTFCSLLWWDELCSTSATLASCSSNARSVRDCSAQSRSHPGTFVSFQRLS